MFHRLVAQAFCENPNNYTIVDHIDRDKHNDNASNLRWVDASINAKNILPKIYKEKKKYLGDFTEKAWKVIQNYPDYMVSENGEFVKIKNNYYLLQQKRNGYLRVLLDGTYYSAHRIIWETFYNQTLSRKEEIDHIDGNKANNKIDNLRLVSHIDNMKNAYHNGHRGQVAVKQYALNGEYLKTYPTIREAALDNNILEAGLKSATDRHGTSGGFYWLRENDPITIEEVMNSWVPEGFTIIPEYPTYCINKKGQVYNKRNKNFTPIHYRADGITPYVIINSKRINIENLMP